MALCRSGLVTVTLANPAACGPVVARISVAVTDDTGAETPPMVTVAPATKFEPAIRTGVPPMVLPVAGVMLVTVGAGDGAAPTEMVPVLTLEAPEADAVIVHRYTPAAA